MKRALHDVVSNLDLKVKDLEAKIRKTQRECDDLERKMEEFERTKKEMEEVEKRLMVESVKLSVKIGEMAAQRAEIEQERALQDAKIAGLQIEAQELQSNVTKLEGMCKDHALLLDDRDGGLHAERGKAKGLRVQGSVFKKSKNLVEEEQNEFALLMKGKALLEIRLAAAQRKLEDTKSRMNSIESHSERILSLPRGVQDARENEAKTEKELQPFATELEAIRIAFMSSEGKIKNLCEEVGMLKVKVAEAQNMIGRLLALLLVATAVFCLTACAANSG